VKLGRTGTIVPIKFHKTQVTVVILKITIQAM